MNRRGEARSDLLLFRNWQDPQYWPEPIELNGSSILVRRPADCAALDAPEYAPETPVTERRPR